MVEKAARVFSRFRRDPESIREKVLAKHGPLLETAKREISGIEGTQGVWSWKHFRCGWASGLGRPEVARRDRCVFARELIEQLALELSKAGMESAEKRQGQAATLFYGAKAYGIQRKMSDAAARAVYTELHTRVSTAWPRYAEARELARKRGWEAEARTMAEKQKAFEKGLVYLGSVTDPGFEERRERLAGP
jgi:hypothetical protein